MKLLFSIMVHFKNKKLEHTVRTRATLFIISPKIVITFFTMIKQINIMKCKLCTLQIMAGKLLKKHFQSKENDGISIFKSLVIWYLCTS